MIGKELTSADRKRLYLRLTIRVLITVAVILTFFFLIPPLLSLFGPFVFGLAVAWMLNPLVRLISGKIGISRETTSLLVVILLFAATGGLLAWFIYGIGAEIASLAINWKTIGTEMGGIMESFAESLKEMATSLPDSVEDSFVGGVNDLTEWIQTRITAGITPALSGAGDFAMSVPAGVVAGVVFLMATYFITADYPSLRYRVSNMVSDNIRSFARTVKNTALAAFGGYIRAELILSLGVMIILLVGFLLIGQSYAILLAVILAVMDFIPIIGSGTILVPWMIIHFIMGNVTSGIELAVMYGVIVLFRRLAEPKIVGDYTGLSPLLCLISIYVGMRLYGVLGMVLGPTILMMAINICKTGIFKNSLADLRCAACDISALLRIPTSRERVSGPKDEKESE